MENVTSSGDVISVTAEIDPSTPLTHIFTQSVNNSTSGANGNVPYMTGSGRMLESRLLVMSFKSNLRRISEKIPASSPQCSPRNFTFCSYHLNYTHTVYPNFAGDKSEDDFIGSWELLQTVVDSFWYTSPFC